MSERIYRGSQITIDLEKNRYQRANDRDWMPLKTVQKVYLTQVKVKQRIGMISISNMHKYEVFCVYLRADDLNILAYRGKRHAVEEEGKRIAEFLNVPIKEVFPRNEDGEIIEDDKGLFGKHPNLITMTVSVVILILLILIFS